MVRQKPINSPDDNEGHEGEEGGGETIHVLGHGTGRGRSSAPKTNPPPQRIPQTGTHPIEKPQSSGGGNGLYQGNIIIKDIAPPPAKDGKAYIIAGTIIGGTRTGTQEDETITGATIEDATIIVHPDSAHPQAGGKTIHTQLTHVTLHLLPPEGVITHYTVADIGVPVPDETGSAVGGSQKNTYPFEPFKTGLPTDILIDPGTFYPQPGEPFSPPASPEKPEKSDPAPQPAPADHKRHHHHHHRHHKH